MSKILLLIVAIGFFSCSVFKKVDKTKVKTEFKTVETMETKRTVTENTVEKVDTTVKLKGSRVENEKAVSEILKGDSLVSENGQVKGVVVYDAKKGTLLLRTEQKPQEITVKKTVEKTKTEEASSNKVTKSDIKTTAKESHKTAIRLPWWLLLIPVAGLGIYYRKKILPGVFS